MSDLRLYSHNFVASKILQIYIESEGCNDPGISGCGHATIRVNGKDYSKHRRGYNVVVVNGRTGIHVFMYSCNVEM